MATVAPSTQKGAKFVVKNTFLDIEEEPCNEDEFQRRRAQTLPINPRRGSEASTEAGTVCNAAEAACSDKESTSASTPDVDNSDEERQQTEPDVEAVETKHRWASMSSEDAKESRSQLLPPRPPGVHVPSPAPSPVTSPRGGPPGVFAGKRTDAGSEGAAAAGPPGIHRSGAAGPPGVFAQPVMVPATVAMEGEVQSVMVPVMMVR